MVAALDLFGLGLGRVALVAALVLDTMAPVTVSVAILLRVTIAALRCVTVIMSNLISSSLFSLKGIRSFTNDAAANNNIVH